MPLTAGCGCSLYGLVCDRAAYHRRAANTACAPLDRHGAAAHAPRAVLCGLLPLLLLPPHLIVLSHCVQLGPAAREHLAEGRVQRQRHDVEEARLRLGDAAARAVHQRAHRQALGLLQVALPEQLLLQQRHPAAMHRARCSQVAQVRALERHLQHQRLLVVVHRLVRLPPAVHRRVRRPAQRLAAAAPAGPAAVELHLGLEHAVDGKVLLHVRRQHHVDDLLADHLAHLVRHLGHEVVLVAVHELEGGRQVVVLHGRAVVVQHGQRVAHADEVVVVHALVLVVVDDGRQVARHQRRLVAVPVVDEAAADDQHVQRLQHVRRVDAVVVRVVGVPVLNLHQELDQLVLVQPPLVHDLAALEQRKRQHGQRPPIRHLVQLERVKLPVVHLGQHAHHLVRHVLGQRNEVAHALLRDGLRLDPQVRQRLVHVLRWLLLNLGRPLAAQQLDQRLRHLVVQHRLAVLHQLLVEVDGLPQVARVQDGVAQVHGLARAHLMPAHDLVQQLERLVRRRVDVDSWLVHGVALRQRLLQLRLQPLVLLLELLFQCLDLGDVLLAHEHCLLMRNGVRERPHLIQHPAVFPWMPLAPPQLREPVAWLVLLEDDAHGF
mmetsp:Transcript_17852/g.45036  ORF Transcript_17852/g.45036 Transcript_17852/m.45036 type:complete len:603 (-) Transcript_17852:971-2779(-)